MALNDTFNISSKKMTQLGSALKSNLPIQDYWEEICKQHPSKKECLFYCD
tara:strand:+ start:120 stop:269 length:150 start_codon:yes stop_codon:yes gene_type:complete